MRWFYLAADSMTMQGPPGAVVSHAPADGVVSSVSTTLGIGIDVAQLKAQDFVAVVAPLTILAVVVAMLRRFESQLTELSRLELIGLVIGLLAVVGLTAATVETLVGVSGPATDQLGDFLFYLSTCRSTAR